MNTNSFHSVERRAELGCTSIETCGQDHLQFSSSGAEHRVLCLPVCHHLRSLNDCVICTTEILSGLDNNLINNIWWESKKLSVATNFFSNSAICSGWVMGGLPLIQPQNGRRDWRVVTAWLICSLPNPSLQTPTYQCKFTKYILTMMLEILCLVQENCYTYFSHPVRWDKEVSRRPCCVIRQFWSIMCKISRNPPRVQFFLSSSKLWWFCWFQFWQKRDNSISPSC